MPPADYSGKDLTEPAQRAVVIHSKTREILWLSVDYHGDAQKFAWIIPCPSEPMVRETSMDIFKEVAEYYHHLDMLAWAKGARHTRFLRGAVGGGVGLSPNEYQVTVHAVRVLGPYEITTVSAEQESGLLTWLQENGYLVPRRAEPLLGAYIAEGWFFAAIKIQTDPETVQSLPPLALEFKTSVPVYPLRISAINPGATDVRVYLFKAGPRGTLSGARRDVRPVYAVQADFAEKCPTLARELPDLGWERLELARVASVLVPQVMSKLDDRFHGTSFYPRRTLAKTSGIAEALLSSNAAEVKWAQENLDYYYGLKYRSGTIPEEHAAEIKHVAQRLGAPLKAKLLDYINQDKHASGSRGARVLLDLMTEPTDR
jgi:hypothetical protein